MGSLPKPITAESGADDSQKPSSTAEVLDYSPLSLQDSLWPRMSLLLVSSDVCALDFLKILERCTSTVALCQGFLSSLLLLTACEYDDSHDELKLRFGWR